MRNIQFSATQLHHLQMDRYDNLKKTANCRSSNAGLDELPKAPKPDVLKLSFAKLQTIGHRSKCVPYCCNIQQTASFWGHMVLNVTYQNLPNLASIDFRQQPPDYKKVPSSSRRSTHVPSYQHQPAAGQHFCIAAASGR